MRRTALPVALALALGLLAFRPARADEHERAAPRILGPALSAVSPEGFAVVLLTPDGPPRPAELLVFDAAARAGAGAAPLARAQGPAATQHRLEVKGLQPGHRYRYRLLLDGAAVTDGEVSTAPPLGADRPLLIAVMGDERGSDWGVSPYAPAVVGGVLSEGPDLVLGTGDLVAEGGDRRAWRQLMLSHGPMLAQLPYYPALGNHELIGDPTASGFRALFPDAARGYYAVRYAQVLLLFLNGNRPGDPAQTAFLERELGRAAGDKGVRRRLVIMHHSPLSVSAHCGLAQEMAPWIARFERFGVDAVLSGHDHCYQRLERNGVAYFVSGGGGAPLYPQSRCAAQDHAALQRYEAAHHYLLLRVDPRRGDAITVTARAPQGRVLDEVTLPLQRQSLAPPIGHGDRGATTLGPGSAEPAPPPPGTPPPPLGPDRKLPVPWWSLGLLPLGLLLYLWLRRR